MRFNRHPLRRDPQRPQLACTWRRLRDELRALKPPERDRVLGFWNRDCVFPPSPFYFELVMQMNRQGLIASAPAIARPR